MKNISVSICFFLLRTVFAVAQSITIEPNPANGTMVNVQNKLNQGFPPSGGTNHAITIPVVTVLPAVAQSGMMVFNAITGKLQYHNGTAWVTPEVIPAGTTVLSETKVNTPLQNAGYSLKGATNTQYNPYAFNSYGWFRPLTGTGAPSIRDGHSAVWTGDKMIVWGGRFGNTYFNDGKIYHPVADAWASMNTSFLSSRKEHAAVWTGSKMIVWGGSNGSGALNDGAVYDLAADSWSTMGSVNAPLARSNFSFIWAGDKMIVWGGFSGGSALNDGKMYNPATNTWTSVSNVNAPSVRSSHTAVWTGSKMIVFGGLGNTGNFLNTGGIYDPATNQWAGMSTTGGPPLGIAEHSAIWTGSQMIIFGGTNGSIATNICYLYAPTTDTWTPANTTNIPLPRYNHTGVWTGSKMIVFGGTDIYSNPGQTGGIYNLTTDTWDTDPISLTDYYSDHTAVWTGEEMIVFGTPGGYLMKKDFTSPQNKTWYFYQKN